MRAVRSLTLRAELAVLMVISTTAPALAQPTDGKVLAEQLFEQGRELAKANKWSEACPKFEASLRYDATLGTRLNLATCYEQTGKLASAWGLFRDAAALAREPDDARRREYALKHAAALLPRLPKLTISGPLASPPGFAITRDGVELDLATLGAALYVDPGSHVVTASAPGFESFKTTIAVNEAESEAVVIPTLSPAKITAVQPPPQPRSGPGEPDRPAGRSDVGRTRRLVGLGVVGGGVVLTGVGLLLGARARSIFDDAKALCGSELICENSTDFERGKDLISRAHTQATFSTVLVVTGAAAVAAGAVVWIIAPRHERVGAAVLPVMTDRDLGFAVAGRF